MYSLTKVLLGSAALLALTAGTASAEKDRMRDAFAKAYVTNPTLEAQRARLRSVDENVNQAISRSRPTVTFRASAGAGLFASNTRASNGTDESVRTPASADIQVTQPIYRGGTNPAAVSQAENEVLAARAGLLNTEQQIFLQVGTSYMNVVRDQAFVELNKNNEIVLKRQLQATRDRFQVGEVTRTDVSQAEARLSSAEADRRQAEGNLASSRASYEEIVGEPPGFLGQPTTFAGLPSDRGQAIDMGAQSNPQVMQATFNHLAASKNVRSVHGELLPRADLIGRAGYNYETSSRDAKSANAEALVQVTVPLYQGGSVRSRVRQAKQVASQRLIEIEQARRAAIQEATTGWEQLVATRARMNALEAEVRAQEIALEGVKQEALVGTRTVLDELNAEQELLDARVGLVEAQRDEVIASLTLAAAVGLLSAQPLNLDVPYYDVRSHYEAVRGSWLGTDINDKWQPASAK